MSSLGDDVFKSAIWGMIFSIPIFIGVAVLSIPFLIVSFITGVEVDILIRNLLIFAIAVFLVWLFSRFQIIENGIVGLVVGEVVHVQLKWHSLACILTGVAVVGLLFFISRIKIGFWIKTILFSLIITFLVFLCLYSKEGLFPLSDMVWKTAFIIIFFLENIFIRSAVAYDKGFLFSKRNVSQMVNSQTGSPSDRGNNQTEFLTNQHDGKGKSADNSTIDELNNFVKQMNAEISEKQEEEESANYLMERVYLFSPKKSFWDGRLIDNMEEKVYNKLKEFIDKDYLILPHVSFREIFWWGEWKTDQKLTDRVTKMHFDFGIYNKELQPILFLEVQGKEHKENLQVIKRDKFKAELMKRCGMKLITIDCSEPMTDQEIREKVIAHIKEEVPDRKSYAAYCPNCKKRGENNLMMLRRNNTDGTFFYGCSTYEKGKQDNCPTLNLEDVPPLYYGIPLFKDKSE